MWHMGHWALWISCTQNKTTHLVLMKAFVRLHMPFGIANLKVRQKFCRSFVDHVPKCYCGGPPCSWACNDKGRRGHVSLCRHML